MTNTSLKAEQRRLFTTVMRSLCGYQLAMGRVCVIKLYLQALASYPGLQRRGKAWVRGSSAARHRLDSAHLLHHVISKSESKYYAIQANNGTAEKNNDIN